VDTVIIWERFLVVGNAWRSDPHWEEERCLTLASRTQLLTPPRNAIVTSSQNAERYAPAKNETTLIQPSGSARSTKRAGRLWISVSAGDLTKVGRQIRVAVAFSG
jgi:hypothetical protein